MGQTASQEPLFEAAPTRRPDPEHHWFVPDDHGHYCRACGLPRANTRHTTKAA